ncbi:hypothetical protein [Herbiconiux ginsengi]|nr:hypothetical protein [Herbiconiux ginsengi]
MSKSAAPAESDRGRSAATYRALLLASVFFVAALLLTLLLGEPLDARVLILYAGAGLFVGGLVTAVSERRPARGDTSAGHLRAQPTREQLERRRLIVFAVAAILAPIWSLTGRGATVRRIAHLDQPST